MTDEPKMYATPAQVVVDLATQWQTYNDKMETPEDHAVHDLMLHLGTKIRETMAHADVAFDAVALFNIVLGMELTLEIPKIMTATGVGDSEDPDSGKLMLIGALASQANVFFTEVV